MNVSARLCIVESSFKRRLARIGTAFVPPGQGKVVSKTPVSGQGPKTSADVLRALATDAAGKLDVLRKDGYTLGVDGAEIGVLKETDEVGLGSLLQGKNGRGLETKVGLEVLRDLANQTLEWQFAQKELGRLLVTTNLTKSNSARPVAMGFLDTTSRGSGLASGLCGESLARSLATSGLASCLLGACHNAETVMRLRADSFC